MSELQERAARVTAAAAALTRAHRPRPGVVFSVAETLQAMEDRRTLAAELGRVLAVLTPEQLEQVFGVEHSTE